MIGVFDSGYGGLTILRALLTAWPEYSYCYFGDNLRAPYGSRPQEEIYAYTLEGVEFLFKQGCELVILGCNTASANALRRLQQEWLPQHYPERRVLGILVPTVEALTDPDPFHQIKTVTILATPSTVQSGAYVREIEKRDASIHVVQQACPTLVALIEQGASELEIRTAIRGYVSLLPYAPETVLLGCTHYALIVDWITQELPVGVIVMRQDELVVQAFKKYLTRHPEIERRLSRASERRFVTSGEAKEVSTLASRFFGQMITFENKD